MLTDQKMAELKKALEKFNKEIPLCVIQTRDLNFEKDHDGHVTWYDKGGATYGQTRDEQKYINEWLIEKVGDRVGFPVVIVELDSVKGRYHLWYKRKTG